MNVTYAGVSYPSTPGEAVLDTLLRHNVSISNSCRAGACQSCLLRASGGVIPAIAQRGLKATLVEQGYFLSCVCLPATDLTIEPATGVEMVAEIASLDRLTASVLRARVRVPERLAYRAGQYVNLRRNDGLARSYSLASLPDEETLELHVRLAPHGKVSGWLFNEAKAGDAVTVRGPAGDCFYTAGNSAQPLLLVGTGTGLAPLAGICRDALRNAHGGAIHLYHGARTAEDLYLQCELGALSANHPGFKYATVVPDSSDVSTAEALFKRIAESHVALSGWRAFICGNPPAVAFLKRKLFLLGVASKDIFTDAFLQGPAPRPGNES